MIRRTLMIIALLALGACAETVTAPTDLPGRFALETVNGKKLPVPRNVGGLSFTVTGGFFEIHADKTFTFGQSVTYEQNGQTVSEDRTGSGLWALTEGVIRFGYSNGALPDRGTIKGDLLSVTTSDEQQLAFRR